MPMQFPEKKDEDFYHTNLEVIKAYYKSSKWDFNSQRVISSDKLIIATRQWDLHCQWMLT